MKKQIVIVSGFSGVGKGTLIKRVLRQLPNLELVRSCTTREKRNDDVFYTFLSNEEFRNLISKDAFLEYNCYSGEFYGTPISEITRILEKGNIPLAEIDTNGFAQVVQSGYFNHEEIHSIFIADDAQSLTNKLLGRKTETKEKIISRLNMAVEESKWITHYDQILINQDLERATDELLSFVTTFSFFNVCFDDCLFRSQLQEIIEKMDSK